MGFFPENSRVEFQGIGRAGRQGQLGSAQVIFSKDEKFFNGHFINSVDDAEMFRMNELIKNSEIRIISSYFEFELYDALKLFFQKLDDIQKLFNNEHFHICFDDICNNKHLSYDTFKKNVIEKFKVDWAEFFSKISKRSFNLRNDINFIIFLKMYEWENLDINKPNFWKDFIIKKINK